VAIENHKGQKSYKLEQVRVLRCIPSEPADSQNACNNVNTESAPVAGESILDRFIRWVKGG